jgi:hypothetical protein
LLNTVRKEREIGPYRSTNLSEHSTDRETERVEESKSVILWHPGLRNTYYVSVTGNYWNVN